MKIEQQDKDQISKAGKIALGVFTFLIFSPLIYMIIWTLMFMNIVEKPLPESEEIVPDSGIVDQPYK